LAPISSFGPVSVFRDYPGKAPAQALMPDQEFPDPGKIGLRVL
jgi:hypothetical protein